jgi:hypothetical protein
MRPAEDQYLRRERGAVSWSVLQYSIVKEAVQNFKIHATDELPQLYDCGCGCCHRETEAEAVDCTESGQPLYYVCYIRTNIARQVPNCSYTRHIVDGRVKSTHSRISAFAMADECP